MRNLRIGPFSWKNLPPFTNHILILPGGRMYNRKQSHMAWKRGSFMRSLKKNTVRIICLVLVVLMVLGVIGTGLMGLM